MVAEALTTAGVPCCWAHASRSGSRSQHATAHNAPDTRCCCRRNAAPTRNALPGLALEVCTAAFPSQFLLLASLGTFSKAVGKGMGKPVFRVVQTHFAAAGNVGAVAAKEEVWEVSAQVRWAQRRSCVAVCDTCVGAR